jgi:TolB-like protein
MTGSTKAVFLSYARDDAAAARRIAEALRSSGLEVWFDENELRGGDSWDQKIRRQINECTLFVPLISQHTQERAKGYFRLEWKLAVDQTHLLAEGVPFIAPVVIDDTRESGAVVPTEFMRVQWTRLPGALPTPQFVEQVQRLLSGKSGMGVSPMSGADDHGRDARTTRTAAGRAFFFRRTTLVWFAIVAAVVVGGVGWFVTQRKPTSEPAPAPPPHALPGSDNAKLQTPNPKPTDAAPAKSIAVLPFANFSAEKENEFFADGLQDEVITALTKIHDLKVISRTSVVAYKDTQGRNLKKIAAELGVATILEGSVQRSGTKVHLNVQLINAATDEHLWADSYTKDLTDVFSVQGELAAAVTSALKATLSPEEKSRITRRPTEDAAAYDFYLHARALSESVGSATVRADYDRIVALYEQAVARDPGFALAHVQLCYWDGIMYWFGILDATPARRARAKAALDAAVRLAPDLPETHLALGAYAYLCENDWMRALAEFRVAEAALPNDAQLGYLIGIAQRRLGRFAEALTTFAHSIELNPRDFTAPPQQMVSLRAMRRFADLQAMATRYLEIFPGKANLLDDLAIAQLELNHDHAAFLNRLEANPPLPNDATGLFKAYRLARLRGDLSAAEKLLADPRFTSLPSAGAVINDPVTLHQAQIAFLRGRTDEARRFATAAIAAYRAQTWVPRAMAGTALAEALAGQPDEAVRLGREANALEAKRDAFNAADVTHILARVYLVLGRNDDALGCLREMMSKPCDVGPELLRLDPLWARVKDDPRFDEILKSARPL